MDTPLIFASQDRMDVLGQVSLTLQVEGKSLAFEEIYVFRNLGREMVIGDDFMYEFGFCLEYEPYRRVRINGELVRITTATCANHKLREVCTRQLPVPLSVPDRSVRNISVALVQCYVARGRISRWRASAGGGRQRVARTRQLQSPGRWNPYEW